MGSIPFCRQCGLAQRKDLPYSVVMIHGVGKLCLDNMMRVDHYPEPNALVHITETGHALGGMAANALKVADHFSSETLLYAHMGSDLTGKILMGELEKTGIGLENILIGESTDYSNIILYGEIRTILSCRNIHHKSTWDFSFSFREGDVLLFDGTIMDGAENLLRMAREGGAVTVMDVSPSHLSRELEALFPWIDYMIPSYDWARRFTGEEKITAISTILLGRGVKHLIMTRGEEGVEYYDSKIHYSLIPEKVTVVNSNGAGDTLHGAFCHGLSRGWGLDRILPFAICAATDRCTRERIDELADEESLLRKSHKLKIL